MEVEVITNVEIRTNEVRLVNNRLEDGEYEIVPQYRRKTGMEGGRYYTELAVKVESTEDRKSPVELYVSITGLFELQGRDGDYIEKFLQKNAVQILLPYLRSIVSNVLTSAMLPPLILPVLNPFTLFPDEEEQTEDTTA